MSLAGETLVRRAEMLPATTPTRVTTPIMMMIIIMTILAVSTTARPRCI